MIYFQAADMVTGLYNEHRESLQCAAACPGGGSEAAGGEAGPGLLELPRGWPAPPHPPPAQPGGGFPFS